MQADPTLAFFAYSRGGASAVVVLKRADEPGTYDGTVTHHRKSSGNTWQARATGHNTAQISQWVRYMVPDLGPRHVVKINTLGIKGEGINPHTTSDDAK